MSTKSERRAAREAVATFHYVQLARLVDHVGQAIDRYRAGDLDAFVRTMTRPPASSREAAMSMRGESYRFGRAYPSRARHER